MKIDRSSSIKRSDLDRFNLLNIKTVSATERSSVIFDRFNLIESNVIHAFSLVFLRHFRDWNASGIQFSSTKIISLSLPLSLFSCVFDATISVEIPGVVQPSRK